MEIIIKNKLNKGDIVPVLVLEDGRIILKRDLEFDITGLIPEEERAHIRRVGRGFAVVKDSETMNIGYYVNYHTHSQYSILDGMSRLKDIAGKSSGITAVTDHGNMFSLMKWQNAMTEEGKKPIFGFEAYAEDILTGEKNGSHLILLAKNEQGLKNLFVLTSTAYDNFYRRPHVSIDNLRKYSEGVICTSACIGGELAKTSRKPEQARNIIRKYKKIFGEDYYVEIQRHNFSGESEVNKVLIDLAKEEGVKLVAANDSHFINPEDEEVHKSLLAVSYGKLTSEVEGFPGTGYHFMSDKEMVNLFWDIPEAISNTLEIAEKCTLKVQTGIYHMPEFKIPKGFSSDQEYLYYLLDKGFKERFSGTTAETSAEYLDRLAYEKGVISQMGFESYFLIVWEYVSWAKEHGVLVGPGRGSGAGSLCLYCLGITEVDPIKHGLKFERFLNPDRISMPDIDMDFEDSKRAAVIEHVKQLYGADHVCNIITFGTMQAKNAIKDLCRVKGLPVSYASTITGKLSDKAKNLQGSLSGDDKSLELLELLESDPVAKEIISDALKIEGNPRQTGKHACGIVVADAPVLNYLPTAMVKDTKNKDAKVLATQVTMGEVEKLGLLKMDFLGLKTLSAIGNGLAMARKRGSEYSSYIDIPCNDPYVYRDIAKGETFGVFQIESGGMRSFMKELFSDVRGRLKNLEEQYEAMGWKSGNTDFQKALELFGEELFARITDGVSLYRPGPMDYIPDYLAGLNDPQNIKYDVPELKEILKPTYGVIVYQEQVMEVVRKLAGFTAGQSDTIRKAMGKKIQEILDEYKPYFIYGSVNAVDSHTGKPLGIAGCVPRGIPEETAVAIWEKMERFAKYAFNKSHGCAYSMITMKCAWLKYYYPCEYMTALVNAYIDDDKAKSYISDIKKLNVELLQPDVNKSDMLFTTDGKAIRYGLRAIKGIQKASETVVAERKTHGEYVSVCDFISRTFPLGVGQKNFVSLVSAGAFDSFGFSRRALDYSASTLYDLAKGNKKQAEKNLADQLSFFNEIGVDETSISYDIENCEDYPEKELLSMERDVIGTYVSAHPLDSYDISADSITDVMDDNGEITEGKYSFAGIITNLREFYTKKGDKMATFTLVDRAGEIKATVFPKDYETFQGLLLDDALVLIKGQVRDDNDFGPQIVVSSVADLDKIGEEQEKVNSVWIYIPTFGGAEAQELLNLLNQKPGDTPVFVRTDTRDYQSPVSVTADSSTYMLLSSKYKVEYH